MNVFLEAVELWGVDAQIDMMIEGCAELIHALQKRKRGRSDNVAEELADVEIMCEQMRFIYGSDKIDYAKMLKLERLHCLIDSQKEGAHLISQCTCGTQAYRDCTAGCPVHGIVKFGGYS